MSPLARPLRIRAGLRVSQYRAKARIEKTCRNWRERVGTCVAELRWSSISMELDLRASAAIDRERADRLRDYGLRS
jgi:hypothetical protein